MNHDLTQSNLSTAVKSEPSNLSIARDGVTINISGPAWLIKDVYERETAPTIRVESANPDAPATPKEWPVFKIGDRVRYVGSSLVGSIEGNIRAPRIYSVRYDGGRLQEHVGMMLERAEDESKPEPNVDVLPQEGEKPKRRRGGNWLLKRTPEERSAHARMMNQAKQDRLASGVVTKDAPRHIHYAKTGGLNVAATVRTLGVGDTIVLPVKSAEAIHREGRVQGWKFAVKQISGNGLRVERVQ